MIYSQDIIFCCCFYCEFGQILEWDAQRGYGVSVLGGAHASPGHGLQPSLTRSALSKALEKVILEVSSDFNYFDCIYCFEEAHC